VTPLVVLAEVSTLTHFLNSVNITDDASAQTTKKNHCNFKLHFKHTVSWCEPNGREGEKIMVGKMFYFQASVSQWKAGIVISYRRRWQGWSV